MLSTELDFLVLASGLVSRVPLGQREGSSVGQTKPPGFLFPVRGTKCEP